MNTRREDQLYVDLIEATARLDTLRACRMDAAELEHQVQDLTEHLQSMAQLMEQAARASPAGINSPMGQRAARLHLILHPDMIEMHRSLYEAGAVYAATVTTH